MNCIENLEKVSSQHEGEIRNHFLFPLIESPQDLNFFLKSYAIEIYHLVEMRSSKGNSSTEIKALFDYLNIKFDDIKDIELSQAQLNLFDFYSSKKSSGQKHHKLVISVFSQREVIAKQVLNMIDHLQHKFTNHDFKNLKVFFEKEIKKENQAQSLKNELSMMRIEKKIDCVKLVENLKVFYQLREKIWSQIVKTIQLQKGIA